MNTSDSAVRVRAFAPECFQVVNTRHLVRAVIYSLQTNFAEIRSDEIAKLGGSFVDCLFRRLGYGIKQEQIDIVIVFAPFPYANDAAAQKDGRQRIIDEFALPARERFVGMFGRDEPIDNLALSLEVGVAVRNKVDHEILRLERIKIVEFRLAGQELIDSSFN